MKKRGELFQELPLFKYNLIIINYIFRFANIRSKTLKTCIQASLIGPY